MAVPGTAVELAEKKTILRVQWKLSSTVHVHVLAQESPKSITDARVPPTAARRREVGFSGDCLCAEEKIAMTTIAKPTRTDELRRRAFKKIIDICEDSISRDDLHMTIQCPKCAKCRLAKKSTKSMQAVTMNSWSNRS